MQFVPAGDFVGETLLDRYLIRGEQRRGRFATFLLADDLRTGAAVVVAFPHAERFTDGAAREEFATQLRSHARLDHRALVKWIDFGIARERPFAVRPLLRGGTLADRIAERGGRPPPPFAVVTWIREIAAALDFCHAHGAVHGDVSPESILFDGGGNASLADLGLAPLAPAAPAASPPTSQGDRRDLAVALHRVLVGAAAADAEGADLAALRPDLSAPLVAAVTRALSNAPELSFASCREFAEAVREGSFAERRQPLSIERPVASTTALQAPAVTALARAVTELAHEPLAAEPPAVAPPALVEPPAPAASPAPDAPAMRSTPRPPPPPWWRSPRAAFVLAVVLIGAGIAFDAWSATRSAHPVKWTGRGGVPPVAERDASLPEVAAKEPELPVAVAPASDPLRRERLRARIASAPLVPWPLHGPAGYARASEFFGARAAWEQTLGDLRDDVFASVELESWVAAASRVANFVAEADSLQLELDELSPLFAVDRRATVCGSLTPPRVELLHLQVTAGSAPRAMALRDGRFAVELELPPDVDALLLSFERLDGTRLADFEVREPPRAVDSALAPGNGNAASAAAPPPAAATTADPVPTATAVASDEIDALLASASFEPVPSDDARPRWRHAKSGLEFVELAVPWGVIEELPGVRDRYGGRGDGSNYLLLVATTECTQGAWRRFRPDDLPEDAVAELPVVGRNGREMIEFCAAMGLELPYGAEWRFFASGGDAGAGIEADAPLETVAWFNANSNGDRQLVAQLRASPLGLFDVRGNVWEACVREDESFPDLLLDSDEASPVVRPYGGGSCHTAATRCQVDHLESFQDGAGASRGFRPVLRIERSR